MSSVPSSGPYQSRVFNFVAKRSRQLGDRLAVALRHAKVASSWGIQLLLYPIYVMVQGTRVVRQRLQPKQQPTSSDYSLTSADDVVYPNSDVAVDRPIQEVLEALNSSVVPPEAATETTETETEIETATPAVEREQATPSLPSSQGWPRFLEKIIDRSQHWWHQYVETYLEKYIGRRSNEGNLASNGGDATTQQQLFFNLDSRDLEISEIALSPQQTIQSVATQLESRTLVLVTPQQEILDILSPQQRQAVCQRIARKLSTYYHRHALAVANNYTVGESQSPLNPGLSWWERLWDWMQTSPVAVKANLFSESSMVAAETASMAPMPVGELAASQTETDTEKALVAAFLEWVCDHSPQTWRRFGASLECAIAKVESGELSPASDLGTVLIKRGQKWLQHEPVQWRSYQLQFHWGEPLEEHPKWQQAQQYIYDLIQTAIAYFFARQVPTETNHSQLHSSASENESTSWGDRMLRWWQNVKAGTLTPYRYPQFQLTQENESWLTMEELFGRAKAYCITTLEDSPTAVVESSQTDRETNQNHPTPSFASTHMSSHPGLWETADGEWIDTEAISLGYDRHPLQIVLEKLDRWMLWLETWWDKIWQWIRQKLNRQT